MSRRTIEMRDGLPRYPHEDVDFVVQELPKHQACSAAKFVEKVLGSEPRPNGSPRTVLQAYNPC